MKILELSRKMFFKCENLNYFYFLFLVYIHVREREWACEREKHEVECSVRPQVSSWIFLNSIFLHSHSKSSPNTIIVYVDTLYFAHSNCVFFISPLWHTVIEFRRWITPTSDLILWSFSKVIIFFMGFLKTR